MARRSRVIPYVATPCAQGPHHRKFWHPHRLLATVGRVTEDEKRQLDMWRTGLSREQRDQCWSFDPSKPLPTGHPLWTQPFLALSGGLVAHPPGFQVDPRVAEFLEQKRQAADVV